MEQLNEWPPQNWKALSVRQPWAELIISGRKTIELRSWTTNYRGPLWIHAGSRPPETTVREIVDQPERLYRGGYVGWATVALVVPMTLNRWGAWRNRHLDPGPFIGGLFGWLFIDVGRLSCPVPAHGHLKLYRPKPADLDRLRECQSHAPEPCQRGGGKLDCPEVL